MSARSTSTEGLPDGDRLGIFVDRTVGVTELCMVYVGRAERLYAPQSTTHDVHLDVAMYEMLHSSLISETTARRELDAAKSRSAAIAREMRRVERAKRRAIRAEARVIRAKESLRRHDQRVIDLRDSQVVHVGRRSLLPW